MDASAALATDAGSWLLWQPEAFGHVHDYDSWSEELEDDEDILRHVRAGDVVPITIGGDGACQFRVRVGSPDDPEGARPTERERAYIVVTSQPYLFVSHGRACLSGIENVGVGPEPLSGLLDLPLPRGRWAVTVVLIGWDEEPGSRDADGRPAAGALPDFLLLLDPEPRSAPPYRQSLTTFDRPAP
jgi:hypothetical protein